MMILLTSDSPTVAYFLCRKSNVDAFQGVSDAATLVRTSCQTVDSVLSGDATWLLLRCAEWLLRDNSNCKHSGQGAVEASPE